MNKIIKDKIQKIFQGLFQRSVIGSVKVSIQVLVRGLVVLFLSASLVNGANSSGSTSSTGVSLPVYKIGPGDVFLFLSGKKRACRRKY